MRADAGADRVDRRQHLNGFGIYKKFIKECAKAIAKIRRLWYNIKDFGRTGNAFAKADVVRDTKLSPKYRTVLCDSSARMSDDEIGGAQSWI